MRPVTKRALVTSVVTALLATASILPGNAAMASEAVPTSDGADAVAAQPEATTESHPTSSDAAAPADSAENQPAPEEGAEDTAAAEAAEPAEATGSNTREDEGTGGPAEADRTENALDAATPSAAASSPAQNSQNEIQAGYANWDFMRSFREYVGVENETRTNVDLLQEGGSLLWKPAPGQSIDVNNLSTLRLQGSVNWLKYEGVLNVSLSNPTIDFAKKQLLLSGSTAGTLSGKKAKTFEQVPLLQMDDLKVERKDGYILIHSLKPRVLDMSDDLVGFYRGAIGSPFVMTIELKGTEADAPKPILWRLFPQTYKDPGNKPILDPNEPIVNVDVDPYLAKCIREELELKEQAPITNKFIQSVQSLQCIGSNDDNDKMKSLRGLEGAKNLTMVRFGYNKISDLTPLAGLTNLHTVEVQGNNITDISALAGLTKLGSLNISDNKVSTLPDMAQMTELAIIKADNNRIKDLSPLPSGSEELRKLYFNNNRIESLEPLRTHVYLRELRVADNRISNVDALKDLRGLERVDLKNNFIADASAIAQWESLKENWDGNIPLSSLELRGNRFTNWDVLNDYGRRIKGKPEAGAEAEAINSRTLEEALAADKKLDEEEAAAEAQRKEEERKKQEEEAKQQQNNAETPDGQPGAAGKTANITWGVRSQFRSYLKGLAKGEWTLSEGATGEFTFPGHANNAVDLANYAGSRSGGKVHFIGHEGLLDITIANPEVRFENGSWLFIADVASRPFNSKDLALLGNPEAMKKALEGRPAPEMRRFTLANLGAPVIAGTGDNMTATFNSFTLTSDGSEAFGRFYDPGRTDFDPIVVSVGDPAAAPEKPQDQAPGDTAPHTEAPSNPPSKELTADLHWGVRKSFLDYVTGPIAHGTVNVSGGVTGSFVFPMAEGKTLPHGDFGGAEFAGTVHFTGHGGLLDLTIANPAIVRDGQAWKLMADVASRPFSMPGARPGTSLRAASALTETPAPARVHLADLDGMTLTHGKDGATVAFSSVELTEKGAEAFGGFYKVGNRSLDPITVALRPVGTAPNVGEQPQANAPKGNQPKDVPSAHAPGYNNAPTASGATPEQKQKKECTVDPNRKRITSGSLSWGVRSSFTTYVRGSIAKGGWNLNGVTWDGSAFNFPVSGGLYNTNTGSGTIYYSGTVHFYGHNGILDLTMSNPAVEINGNSGTLYMTVAGSDTSGNKFNLGRVAFASLGFNGVSVSDNALSFKGASVTLTDTGAKAFAGFYQAGTSLDAMSSSVSLTPATACDPETGELIEYDAFGGVAGSGGLASTGTEASALMWMSLMALALGAAALGARARQRI